VAIATKARTRLRNLKRYATATMFKLAEADEQIKGLPKLMANESIPTHFVSATKEVIVFLVVRLTWDL
jgi:hypothetical protein